VNETFSEITGVALLSMYSGVNGDSNEAIMPLSSSLLEISGFVASSCTRLDNMTSGVKGTWLGTLSLLPSLSLFRYSLSIVVVCSRCQTHASVSSTLLMSG